MVQTRPITGKVLPPEPLLYPTELFKMVCNAPDRETRIKMLREYSIKDANHSKVLRSIIELAWHPAIVWELPEGAPPYTAASPHVREAPTSLFRVMREVSRFLKGGGGFIQNPLKREKYFTQILESLSAPEALLLIAIKDKTISELYPKVTLDLIVQTFPDLLPADIVAANPPVEDTPEDPKSPTTEAPSSQESDGGEEKPAKKPRVAGRKREIN